MLAALILTAIYNSIFNSILAVPQFQAPIDTIDDLIGAIKDDSHQIFLGQNFELFRKGFIKSRPDNKVFYQIGKHINRFES